MSRTTSRSAKQAVRRWRQRSLLTALGLVFAVSAVMRLGSLDLAFAEEVLGTPTEPAVVAEPGPQPAIASDRVVAALGDIEALRSRLEMREVLLDDRERAVAAAQVLVEERLVELEAAEARLSVLVAISDQAAETDLDRLTRVYETMPPEQSAPLFAQMAPSFAAGFMSRMTPASSAALMAELDPETAYAISVVMATRNANAPVLGPDARSEDTQN